MNMWNWGWGPGAWGLLSLTLFVLFWVVVGWLIVTLVRRDRYAPPPSGPAHPVRSPALDVLEERYARGEISREEFVERRAVLLGDHRPSPGPKC